MFAALRIHAEDRASLQTVPAVGGAPVKLADVSRPAGATLDVPVWFGFFGYIPWYAYYQW